MLSLTFWLLSITCFSQLSIHLIQLLPDSLKPKNKDNITLKEATRILNNAYKLDRLNKGEIREIDRFALRVAPSYTIIKSQAEKINFLESVCRHMFNSLNLFPFRQISQDEDLFKSKSINNNNRNWPIPNNEVLVPDTAIFYVNAWLDLMYRKQPENLRKVHLAYLFRASFLAFKKSHIEAHGNYMQMMQFARLIPDTVNMARSYLALAGFYNNLGLPNLAHIYCDSAFSLNVLQNSDVPSVKAGYAGYIWELQRVYLGLFMRNKNPEYADSIRIFHERQLFDNYTKGRRRASSFIMLSELSFYESNYVDAVRFVDSAATMFPNLGYLKMWEAAVIFKSLSLLKLGRGNEGVRLLDTLYMNDLTSEYWQMALVEFAKFEMKSGHYPKANKYLQLLGVAGKSRDEKLKQVAAIEMSGLYERSIKSLSVERLRLIEKNKLLKAGIIIGLLVLLLFALAYRIFKQQTKTRGLLKQLDEVIQAQVLMLEETKDTERKNFGQMLHDNLAPTLAATMHFLKQKAQSKKNDWEKEELMKYANSLEESYNSTRRQSHNLFLESSSRQFCETLREKVSLFFANTNTTIEFSEEVSGLILPNDIKVALLLVFQEAITNIIKHSKANHVDILLYSEDDLLIVEINDNGKGITGHLKSGIGLQSIKKRIKEINGVIYIQSGKPTGTNIKMEIPISDARQKAV